MNSNMVQPEQFDHLHLVYHFTVPLNSGFTFAILQASGKPLKGTVMQII